MKDGEYPWAVTDTPNQQLAHILSSYFNDRRYVDAAYCIRAATSHLQPPNNRTEKENV